MRVAEMSTRLGTPVFRNQQYLGTHHRLFSDATAEQTAQSFGSSVLSDSSFSSLPHYLVIRLDGSINLLPGKQIVNS